MEYMSSSLLIFKNTFANLDLKEQSQPLMCRFETLRCTSSSDDGAWGLHKAFTDATLGQIHSFSVVAQGIRFLGSGVGRAGGVEAPPPRPPPYSQGVVTTPPFLLALPLAKPWLHLCSWVFNLVHDGTTMHGMALGTAERLIVDFNGL